MLAFFAVSRYEAEGHSHFATANLWDDGLIDPADTREVRDLHLCAGWTIRRPALAVLVHVHACDSILQAGLPAVFL